MELARRICKLCGESSLSPALMALEAGLEKELLAGLRAGEIVPTWDILERLACTLDVPIHRFFFDSGQPTATPWLTPRVTFQQLAHPAPKLERRVARSKGFLHGMRK